MWLDWMFKNDITPSWKVTSFSLTMSKNHESPPQRNPTVLSHDRPLLNHILETLCELYMWWWRSFHRKEIFSVHDATAKLQKRTDVSTLYSKRITDLVILTFIWIYLFIKVDLCIRFFSLLQNVLQVYANVSLQSQVCGLIGSSSVVYRKERKDDNMMKQKVNMCHKHRSSSRS